MQWTKRIHVMGIRTKKMTSLGTLCMRNENKGEMMTIQKMDPPKKKFTQENTFFFLFVLDSGMKRQAFHPRRVISELPTVETTVNEELTK